MGEAIYNSGLHSQAAMQQHYGGAPGAVRQRFKIYDTCIDGRDIHREAIEAAGPLVGQVVVDIGCGGGEALTHIASTEEPPALLIGIDLDTDLVRLNKKQKEPAHDIVYSTANAEALPFADNSVDTMFALFMLYHVADLPKAFKEFQRVLKPEGQLIVATSGSDNKYFHRKFEKEIAEKLGVSKPPLLNADFDSEHAATKLSHYFDIKEKSDQRSTLAIDRDEVQNYLDSIDSMRSLFRPVPAGSVWNNVVRKVVERSIRDEINAQGYFGELAIRDYFVCIPKALRTTQL